MSSFKCSYCEHTVPLINETFTGVVADFDSYDIFSINSSGVFSGSRYKSFTDLLTAENFVILSFLKCSNCKKMTINARLTGEIPKQIPLQPRFSCINYPDYIPQAIRKDYEEASEILTVSPKAAATLARRCMQGIIRDFWGVSGKTLYQEIDMIKDKVSPDIWSALDSLRELGNIGAHMEKDINLIVDIDPKEAESLIQFIELLISEWYVARDNRQKLLNKIPAINDQKQNQRT